MNFVAAMEPLTDVEGVYGSFLVNDVGQLLHRSLPIVIDNASLASAGTRIKRLWSNLPEDETPQSALLEFKHHKLFIRPVKNGNLCVLVASKVHLLELKQAVECAARSLEKIVHAPVNEGFPQVPKASRTFVYRGTIYED